MSEKSIEKWLLSGGGGFEGTPEASTFTFHGLVSMIDAYDEYIGEKLAQEQARSRRLTEKLEEIYKQCSDHKPDSISCSCHHIAPWLVRQALTPDGATEGE